MQAAGASIVSVDAEMGRLLAEREERPVFLNPVWLRIWLSEFGDMGGGGATCEPVMLVSTGAKADAGGVAPLMRVDERLTFIGDPSICDFMDFLVADGDSAGVYADLWRQIDAEDWTELDLWGLLASSATRWQIAGLAREGGYEVRETLEAVSPRVGLPSTWDHYLAGLGKKDRHELRRKIRRLFESGAEVSFEVLSEQSDIVAAMDTFIDLHVSSRMDKTEFMTDSMALFFRRMTSALSAEGLVKLFMLKINARPAACVLGFDAGSQLYMYNSGYEPEFSSLAVGLVSKALCLRWAIENGKAGLDFLRGDEAYKYDLGASNQEIFRLLVTRRPA